LLFTAFAWGQAAKPAAPPAPPKATSASTAAPSKSAGTVAPDAAVITLPGLCDKPAAQKANAAECKTVVTRAEFELLISAVAPTIAPAARKQLATQYGTALVMVHKAHEMGLDQGPKFQELMRVARIGVITKELNQRLQDDASKIPDQDIEAYYHSNEAAFQQADMERVFIPRSKQVVESKDKPLDDAAKKSQQESEETMKKLADTLRARAAAGEDFEKLQDEAAAAADFKGKPPTKLGKVRRTSLPPDQAQVFNLKPGEASQVINTPNGYLIYKTGEKDTLPLDKVRDEIFSTLRSQRMQETLQKMQASATPQLNDQYFSPAPAATGPAAPVMKAPETGPK
jgi:PPIC-type PPIASE domain